QLAEAPALLTLPTDRARPAVQRFAGDVVTAELPAAQAAQLRAWARAHNGTLFMALLAVFKGGLWRWTGQADVVVGAGVAGRGQAAVEPLIGCFMNMVPLRTRWEAGEPVSALLARLVDTVLTGYAHQACPFEKILEAVNPRRDASYNPV